MSIPKVLTGHEIRPEFEDKQAIVFESSQLFVPYMDVALISLLQHIEDSHNYDIIILTKEIEEYDQQLLQRHAGTKKNVSIRFFDPSPIVKEFYNNARYSYLEINYYRLALPWILKEYDRALNLGADILVNRDVHELINIELSDNVYIAGARDLGYIGRLSIDISKEELGLADPFSYVNADVMLFDLNAIRLNHSIDDVMNPWQKYHLRCAEQDALNMLYNEHVKCFSYKWNLFPERMLSANDISHAPKEFLNEYNKCLDEPYIVHYAAVPKPWDYPMVGYGHLWWAAARQSVYYEEMLRRMGLCSVASQYNDTHSTARKIVDFLLPAGTRRRSFCKKLFPKGSGQRRMIKRIYSCLFHHGQDESEIRYGRMSNK